MNGEFHRVHRLTPLLRFWTLILAMIAVTMLNVNLSSVVMLWRWIQAGHWGAVGIAIGGFLGACALVWFGSHLWWKALGYRLDSEELALKHGVFNTRLRTARYDRIQAVDVVESLIARIFSLAAVRVETAGGNNSVIEIAYLPKPQAEAVRSEVLNRVHAHRNVSLLGELDERVTQDLGVEDFAEQERHPEQGTQPHTRSVTPLAEDEGTVVIPAIPIRRSLLGTLTEGVSYTAAFTLLGVYLSPLTLAFLVPMAIGIVPAVWGLIDRSWRFNARLSGQTLHVAYGLADRRRQAIPLHRIHAVEVKQPILWRLFGWWMVKVSVAGYGPNSNKASGTSRIMPVGTKEQALSLMELLSDLKAEEIASLADPEEFGTPTYTSPPRAKWVSPLDFSRQAVTLFGDCVIVHQGRLSRRVKVVHSSHIQELSLVRGPLQQRLDLCHVRFDLVNGPILMTGEDLSPEQGRKLLDGLRQRTLPSVQH